MYRRIRGLGFVPRYFGRFDKDSIVLEKLVATPLTAFQSRTSIPALDLHPSFIDDLQRCVDQLHARGVVHMDLRHRRNILVDVHGRPRIVDFETAVYVGRWLVPVLAWIDHSAVTKFRMRYFPEQVTARDAKRYARFRILRKLWPFGRIWPPAQRRAPRSPRCWGDPPQVV